MAKTKISIKKGARGASLGEVANKIGISPSAPRKVLLRKANVKLNTHIRVERK